MCACRGARFARAETTLAFSPNKRKLLEAAQKYAQKGQYDKALKEYQKALKQDPKDSNLRLKIGDLYLKKGENEQAIDSYRQVAEEFSKGGFDAKAVAIYKQILRVDGGNLTARTALGDHFQRMGLMSDALREFQGAVELCQERGMKREAFDLLKRVAALDPGNVPNRLKLADLLAREGLADESRETYSALLSDVVAQTGADVVIRVAEQTLEAFPDHTEAIEALSNAQIAMGEPDKAIGRLQQVAAAAPDDLQVRETLINAYEAIGDDEGKKRTWAEIAELYKRRGDVDKAREILQIHVPVESFSPDDGEGTSPSILLTDETRGDIAVDPDTAASLEIDTPTGLDVGGTAAALGVDELVAEARVSFEFGDPDEARRLVRLALEREPGCAAAAELLEQMRQPKAGRGPAAKKEASAPAPPAKSPPALPEVPEIELELEPTSLAEAPPAAEKPAAKKPAAKKPAAKPAAAAEDPELEKLPDIEIVLDDEEDSDDAYASVEPPEELIDLDRPLAATPAKPAAKPEPVAAAPEQADGDLEFELDLDGELQLDTDAGDDAGDGDADADGSIPDGPTYTNDVAPPGESWNDSTRISEQLEEAEFFLQQGMLDEAERALAKVLDAAPQHPQALLRMGEIESQRGAGAASPAEAEESLPSLAPIPGDDPLSIPEVDLGGATATAGTTTPEAPPEPASDESATEQEAADSPISDLQDLVADELADELPTDLRAIADPAPAEDEEAFDLAAALDDGGDEEESPTLTGHVSPGTGFDDVFSSFKRGIQEQLGDEDVDAHYDLAIAYKEMGLLDDAIRELDTVRKSATREVEALSLMGMCRIELGRADEAVNDFRSALSAAEDDPARSLALRFDLAEALLAAGQRDEALATFREVDAADPDYRGVRERIAELT